MNAARGTHGGRARPIMIPGVMPDPSVRLFITTSVILATLLHSVDMTIAVVALPHIRGSLQSSADQTAWVLTSYILATGIVTPLVPWAAARFGRRKVYLSAVLGFTVASMLCGLAQNLGEMVLFRLLQGGSGAALLPLAQAVLFDINPPERHGRAMAGYATAAMVGPILGPAIGGWLTEAYDWRWVFLINLPGGVLAFTGLYLFLPEVESPGKRRLDGIGFASIAMAIGAFQLMLDRGPGQGWFESLEIWGELTVSLTALYVFVVHTLTDSRPFFPPALFRDRNFIFGSMVGALASATLFSVLSLTPVLLQTLMGYPALTSGYVTTSRGLGNLLVMIPAGRLMGRVDTRWILATGGILSVVSLYQMSCFSLEMGPWPVVWAGLFQGMGVGLIYVPLATLVFSTLTPSLRTDGAALFNVIRNLSSSVGISFMQWSLIANTARARDALAAHIHPGNPLLARLPAIMDVQAQTGLTLTNGLIIRQASMIAYLNNYRMMAVAMAFAFPVLVFLRKPRRA